MTQSTSFTIIAERALKAAKAAFGAFGNIGKALINGTEFAPEQTASALVSVVMNWDDAQAFAITRINGICTLRVATGRRS